MEEPVKVSETARSERYAVGERILILMRDFVGDNQQKAAYHARVELLRKFIKNPREHGGDKRLKEINTLLETLNQGIDRQEFLNEQLKSLVFPDVDMSSCPHEILFKVLFPLLSVSDLENYAKLSATAREQVDAYYKFIIYQTKVSGKKLEFFNLILSKNWEALANFLNGEINPKIFLNIVGFSPILYLKNHGNQEALDRIYSLMVQGVVDKKELLKLKICTGQKLDSDEEDELRCYSIGGFRWSYEEIRSLFELACEYDDYKVVKLIVSNPSLREEAIKRDDIATIRRLAANGVNLVSEWNFSYWENGITLHRSMRFVEFAILNHKNKVAKYLVDKHLEHIPAEDDERARPFAAACEGRNIEMLRYLCQKTRGMPGLNNIIKYKNVLSYALNWGNPEAVELLSSLSRNGLIYSLEEYIEKHPKHTIAKRLHGIISHPNDTKALTRGERFYLFIAKLFKTELGKIYLWAEDFLSSQNKKDPSVNKAEKSNRERTPLLRRPHFIENPRPVFSSSRNHRPVFFERSDPAASRQPQLPEDINNSNNYPVQFRPNK